MINYDEKYDIMYFIFENTTGTYGDEDDNGVVLLRKAESDDIAGIIIYDYSTRQKNYDEQFDILDIRFAPNANSYGEDIAVGYVLFKNIEHENITGLKLFNYKKRKEEALHKYNPPYSAKDVAKLIINCSNSKNASISNLKLQKLLYLVWIDYYKCKKQYLFYDNFEAWKIGVILPKIYYEYSIYGGMNIGKKYKQSKIFISQEDKDIIRTLLDIHIYLQASTIVNDLDENYKPWADIYKNGSGNKRVIPFDQIVKWNISPMF